MSLPRLFKTPLLILTISLLSLFVNITVYSAEGAGCIFAWGDNLWGQIGDGTSGADEYRITPIAVDDIDTAVAISAGGSHTAALLSDGTIKAWGYNYCGQLGDGTGGEGEYSTTPVTVVGIDTAVAISAGGEHTVALLADGTIKAWGNNLDGQLGDGTGGYPGFGLPNRSLTPVTVVGIDNAIAVSAGYSHTVALLADGTIKAWGSNLYGQIGDGTSGADEYRITPIAVDDIDTAVAISAGGSHTVALLADGTLRAWGSDCDGQLGDGTDVNPLTPVTVVDIDTAVAVAAGYSHTVAVLADGTIKAWGSNYCGKLGDGTFEDRLTPVTVVDIDTAIAVAAGGEHTAALLADGSIKAWGGNLYGQIGDGTSGPGEYSSTPVAVTGINTAIMVSAGAGHTVAACVSDEPATTITSGPTSPLPDSNVEFTFEANMPVTCFYYRLWPLESGYSKTTLTRKYYNNLSDGDYTFIVFARGTDDTLETTPARCSFTVNVPSTEINSRITAGPDYVDHDGNVDLTFEANMAVKSFYYRLYGYEDTYTKTTNTTKSYTGLANGDYQFIVFARAADDTLEATAARWSFKVLNEIDTTIASGPSTPDTDGNVSFTWIADRPAQKYYYRLWPTEGGYTATTETTKSYTGLADGNYEFIVLARDMIGNLETTPDRWWFNVTVAPGMAMAQTTEETTSSVDTEEMLIELYPNEEAREETISLFKNVPFTLAQDSQVYIEVVSTCATGANDDDLVVVLRGSDAAVTLMKFNGDDIAGASASKLAQANLAAGDYTLEIYAEGSPTLHTVKISTVPLTDLLDAQISEQPARIELGLFKEFQFAGAGDLTLQVAAKANAGDDVVVYLDGVSYGMDTSDSIDGDVTKGEVKVLDIPVSSLAAGEHTLLLVTQGAPEVYAVRVVQDGGELIKIVMNEVLDAEPTSIQFTADAAADVTVSMTATAAGPVTLALDGKAFASASPDANGKVKLSATALVSAGRHAISITTLNEAVLKSIVVREIQ